jgi:translin
MRNLQNIVQTIEKELEDKDRVREGALRASRELIRLSKDVLGAMNRKEDPRPLLGQMRKDAAKLRAQTGKYPELYHAGYVEAALAEVVEICLLYAILDKATLPTPKELSATPESYLLGLGDVIGELRRMAVDALRAMRPEDAEARLTEMETIYEALMRFDFPDAVVPLRKKQDVARSLVERTRGEVLVARSEKALKDKLDRVAAHLDRSYGGGQGQRRYHGRDQRQR